MKTWPKIKLVDGRGRTVTIFKRVPVFEEDDSQGLVVHEVVDHPPPKPLSEIPLAQASPLIEDDFLDFIRGFFAAHGRMPGAVTEHVVADAAEVVAALQEMLSAHGLSMITREELTDLLEERTRLIRRTSETTLQFSSCSALAEHVEAAERAGRDEFEIPRSGDIHFVGAPTGKSKWTAAAKPASNKAMSHADAELERTGASVVRMSPGHTVTFDGVKLPAWDDVQMVLDDVAAHGEAGDTLTLTIDQLRRLIAQRC